MFFLRSITCARPHPDQRVCIEFNHADMIWLVARERLVIISNFAKHEVPTFGENDLDEQLGKVFSK